MTPLNIAEWQSLDRHYSDIKYLSMREQFALDSGRFERFSIRSGDLLLDYSKNRITQETIDKLIALADAVNIQEWIERMFSGDQINHTEGRAVLHTALRNRSNTPVMVDGQDVMPQVNAVLDKMAAFCEQVHSGKWLGFSNKKITDIVNIGIGGSDLGPAMICDALEPYGIDGIQAHFVSNVDGTDLSTTLEKLNPETTLFVVASKTFTTQETITNAQSARNWFLKAGTQADVAKHFVAVSTNAKEVAKFGIDTANMFEIWDWVGGRYSLWSAIGLPIALYVGMDNFLRLLDGGHEMDKHFRTKPLAENIPLIMGMLGIWYINFFNAQTHAIVPYDHSLARFPSHMQQLDMESNGKFINRQGARISYKTGPVIWGTPGTNGQHAYFQLIHQGTQLIPVDFVLPVNSHYPECDHQSILLANGLAQSEALMKGKTAEEVREELVKEGYEGKALDALLPHKVFPGNRPSNVLLFPKLTPEMLGQLVALYEHKVFVQGVIWNINSFDQWGVELGKQLAKAILPDLQSNAEISVHDSSTTELIRLIRTLRQ
ncbi:glucose-6-phosphate isomerase [Methylophaga nitratireducenticrescens]|uniref:Glucose-6-phosphate isomerase n=1 Tax=Methylophaga nitratireducenticrescens TaxID=754476 RepID=I1XLT0_METNJ|nr:glucose-6-phosphate isomerase [Methylophaga nitratireducenticrescens]AFI85349.1 glucose-6-phosphate isomerase [Methylophaga nitratireducenticrescens]AUZ85115.1 glucose-6-phosphate isomerase [Methylophaga nitratireducenticrescens]